MEHELKCWPGVFQAQLDGVKGFEYRINDRDFKTGDTLYQREWDPEKKFYTGREMHQKVGDIVYGGRFGIPKGFCIMDVRCQENAMLRNDLGVGQKKINDMDNTKAQETMDAELAALAALVTASSRQMEMADRERLSHGYSVAYGDRAAEGQDELSAMLRLREGIFNKPAASPDRGAGRKGEGR